MLFCSVCLVLLQMTNPAIQNDFSYYRRTLSRMRINNVPVSALRPPHLWATIIDVCVTTDHWIDYLHVTGVAFSDEPTN